MTDTPATRPPHAPTATNGAAPDTGATPGRADAPQTPTQPRQEIHIRWRRYGKHGGRWRAEFPPGHGIDSGWVESKSLDTVKGMANLMALRTGHTVTVHEEPDDA